MYAVNEFCKKKNVLKFVVGNKCDLTGERRNTFDDLTEMVDDYNYYSICFETSMLSEFKSTNDELSY